jgi:hypothetical protein
LNSLEQETASRVRYLKHQCEFTDLATGVISPRRFLTNVNIRARLPTDAQPAIIPNGMSTVAWLMQPAQQPGGANEQVIAANLTPYLTEEAQCLVQVLYPLVETPLTGHPNSGFFAVQMLHEELGPRAIAGTLSNVHSSLIEEHMPTNNCMIDSWLRTKIELQKTLEGSPYAVTDLALQSHLRRLIDQRRFGRLLRERATNHIDEMSMQEFRTTLIKYEFDNHLKKGSLRVDGTYDMILMSSSHPNEPTDGYRGGGRGRGGQAGRGTGGRGGGRGGSGGRGPGGRGGGRGPPPTAYTCHRCGSPEHWIQDCPEAQQHVQQMQAPAQQPIGGGQAAAQQPAGDDQGAPPAAQGNQAAPGGQAHAAAVDRYPNGNPAMRGQRTLMLHTPTHTFGQAHFGPVQDLFSTSIIETLTREERSRIFMLDTGATTHAANSRAGFTTFTKRTITIGLADESSSLSAEGYGELMMAEGLDFNLGDVMYVPSFIVNIVSGPRLVQNGCSLYFRNGVCTVSRDDEILFRAYPDARLNGLYVLDIEDAVRESSLRGNDGMGRMFGNETVLATDVSVEPAAVEPVEAAACDDDEEDTDFDELDDDGPDLLPPSDDEDDDDDNSSGAAVNESEAAASNYATDDRAAEDEPPPAPEDEYLDGDYVLMDGMDHVLLEDMAPIVHSGIEIDPGVVWHQRYGHFGNALQNRSSKTVPGVPRNNTKVKCVPCKQFRITKTRLSKAREHKALHFGERVYIDPIGGKLPPSAEGGHTGFLFAIDEATGLKVTVLYKSKKEYEQCLLQLTDYLRTVQELLPEGMRRLTTLHYTHDPAVEVTSQYVQDQLAGKNVILETMPPESWRQMGPIERAHGVIRGPLQAMLADAGMGMEHWPDALRQIIYVSNHYCVTATQSDTPYHLTTGKHAQGKFLKVFGAPCVFKIHDQARAHKHYGPKGRIGVNLGNIPGGCGYYIMDYETKKVLERADVVMFEDLRAKDDIIKRGMLLQRRLIGTGPPGVKPKRAAIAKEHRRTSDRLARGGLPVPPSRAEKGLRAVEDAEREENELCRVADITARAGAPPRGTGPAQDELPQLRDRLQQPEEFSPASEGAQAAPPEAPPEAPHEEGRTGQLRSGRAYGVGLVAMAAGLHDMGSGIWHHHDSGATIFCVGGENILTIYPADGEHAYTMHHLGRDPLNPRNEKEALEGPYSAEFEVAFSKEHQQLRDMGVYVLKSKLDLEPGASVLKSRMLAKAKLDSEGNIEKFKGRFVAKGFTQRYGDDYESTFAPTPRMATLRIFIIIALEERAVVIQFDVSGAYLLGDIDTGGTTNPIYIELPSSEGGDDFVGRLLKGLYGTKQAGHIWWKTFSAELLNEGFSVCVNDACVYQRIEPDGRYTRFLIWVDDMYTSGERDTIMTAVDNIRKRTDWDIRHVGDGSWFIGMKITYCPAEGWATMDMFAFVKSFLAKYGYENIPIKESPARANFVLPKFTAEEAVLEREQRAEHAVTPNRAFPYAAIVGSLQWLTNTMPDIQQAVSACGKHREHHGKAHINAVLRIVGYARGVMERGERVILRSSKDGAPVLEAFSDADHASEWRTSGHSTTGVVVALNRSPVSTICKKQTGIADSTMEAESTAAATAYKEIAWVRNFLGECGYTQLRATPLFVDNEAAIKAAANPLHHSRAKHIALKLWLLRRAVDLGIIDLIHVKTMLELADIFTKPLAREVFRRLQLRLYGIAPWEVDMVAPGRLKVTSYDGHDG